MTINGFLWSQARMLWRRHWENSRVKIHDNYCFFVNTEDGFSRILQSFPESEMPEKLLLLTIIPSKALLFYKLHASSDGYNQFFNW